MEDYYPNEIPIIMQEYAKLNKEAESNEDVVDAEDF